MGNKKSLPDSLELLLDTMCNTFGGIMFIAISLVVMSQLLTQQQKNMSSEEISRRAIEQLKQKIEVLQKENAALEKTALRISMKTGNVSKEKKEAILRLKQAKENNLIFDDHLEDLEIKIKSNTEVQKQLQKTISTLTAELERKRKAFHARKQKNLQKKQVLAEEIRRLEEQLKNIQPPTLRFAKLQSVKKTPYWILIQYNKIYRWGDAANPRRGEVEPEISQSSRIVWLRPVTGTAIEDDPKNVLPYLFRGIDKNKYFINILSDEESFSGLMLTRQFLRSNNFMSNWSINKKFELMLSDDVDYEASE